MRLFVVGLVLFLSVTEFAEAYRYGRYGNGRGYGRGSGYGNRYDSDSSSSESYEHGWNRGRGRTTLPPRRPSVTSTSRPGGRWNATTTSAPVFQCEEETKTLDQLYQEALTAGGNLIIYAGGDTANQQDFNKAAFEQKFPGVKVTVIVDYSKFHDARIDYQLQTNTLVPDIVQLQTLQDFPRWKNESVLQNYKPAGFCKVNDNFKDVDGAWVGIFIDGFSIIYNNDLVNSASAPKNAQDLLDSQWKGKIVSTYPHDDDAVLFLYKKIIDQYGWSWLDAFILNEIKWVRGTQEPADQVEGGTSSIALGTDGALIPGDTKTRFVIPETDPFMAWAQRAAIFKDAKNTATAKLYLNWWLSVETQKNFYMWSVRTDVAAPAGFSKAWEYANSNMDEFVSFMADREGVERFKTQISLHIGEVKGDPSPGWLGLYPGRQ